MSNQQKPKVTVIVAAYNKSEALYYALKSVLWQTFTDFECWVVGDACTDNSAAVVAGFDDRRLQWHNLPENSGYQSAPNNEGLRRAKGQYIAYLNHDDLWLPNHLQLLVESIERSQSDFVYSIMEMIFANSQRADIPNFPDSPRPPEASATLHRRDVVDKIGFWKAPQETSSFPRVDFFRQAQFAGLSFTLAPYLTVLKFSHNKAGYAYANQQAEYVHRICHEPDFVEKELSNMLIDAYWKLEGPLSLSRVRVSDSANAPLCDGKTWHRSRHLNTMAQAGEPS